MKWLGIFAGLIVVLLAALYGLLFTAPGNTLLTPVIEKKINGATELQASLERFELHPGRFAVTLVLSPGNSCEAEGEFGLFNRRLTATYSLVVADLTGLQPLTQTTLYGSLQTAGTVTGRFNDLLLSGSSTLAGGKTSYAVQLLSFKPGAIQATISDAKVTQLLEMVGKKPFSTANLSFKMDLKSLKPQDMEGEVLLTISKGSIDTALMKEEFDLTLPETSYTMQATSHLQGREIRYRVSLDSNLAQLLSEGTVAPESWQTNLNYNVDIAKLELLKPLTNSPLRGPVKTAGTVKGDRRKMTISGTSDLAASQTTYDVTLAEFKAKQVLAKITNGKLDKLLTMTGQPAAATGRVDVDLTLTDLDPDNLKGRAVVKISQGALVPAVFKKEYDLSLPQTAFSYDLQAQLQGRDISLTTRLDSTLAKIGAQGSLVPKTMAMDLSYDVDIAKLEVLQPFTGTALRGPLKLKGTAKGDRTLLNIAGASDLAGSATTFQAGLNDFALATITAKIKNLQLGRALAMLAKPHYGDGVLNAEINITSAKADELKGSITSEISKGVVDGKVIAAEFGLGALPATTFTTKTQTTLAGSFIDTATTLTSSLMTLKMQRTRYDLKNEVLTSDYQAAIPDLDRLFFVTGRHLKGAMTVTGDLKNDKHLKFTAHADTLGGRVDVTVLDDDVHADIKKIQTLETLTMLLYPEILASGLDGTLDYNLKGQKGIFVANLSDGKFTRNIMLDLLLQLAGTDLYKERFTGTLHSQINKELITSDLDLRSKKSSIVGKQTTLNTKTKQVKAKLDVVANNNPIGVTIKGNVDDPSVKIDTSALIEKEAGKLIEKEVNKLLKDLFK
ncbi:MAG: hypothetical protein KKG53_00235 [Proteobacteria bacterium]|nr:hypothetical protein [Pseudomonadota bacterium]